MPDDTPTRPAPREQQPAGLKQAIAEQFSLQAVIGGPRGLAESILPMTVFTVVWALTHDLTRSVLAALVPSVLLAGWRVLAREPLTQALSGVLGIALGAGIALYTGRAQDFFLVGIAKNVGFAVGYAVSSLVRWPVIGVLLGFMLGEDLNWRRVRPRMRVYQQATWIWVGLFALRAAVQGWLYLTGRTTALGFANILLGLPPFGLAVGLTWLLIRRVPVAKPPDEPAADEQVSKPEPEVAEAVDEPAPDEQVRAEAGRD